MQSVQAASVDQTANPDILRTVELSIRLKGSSTFSPLSSPFNITDSSTIDRLHAKYSFELEDHVNPITGEPQRTVSSGDYYIIELPAKVQLLAPVNGTITGNDNRALANYTFTQKPDSSWQIIITFTSYIDDLNEFEIHGSMEFDFILDLSAVAGGTSTTITIPIDNDNNIDINVTKPIPLPTTPVSLTKTITSYTTSTRELVWNIKIMPDIGKFSGTTFTDILDVSKVDLKSVRHGSVNLTLGTDYTYDPLTGRLTYLIPSGRDGLSFQNIIVTAVVKRAVYGVLTPTAITNVATLTGGVSDVSLVSNSVTQTITPNWFTKTGTVVQGNKIQWTMDINANTQSMFNGVITDTLSSQLTLDQSSIRWGGAAVSLYPDTYIPSTASEVYATLSAQGDGSSILRVYLPRTQALASSTRRSLTFITSAETPTLLTPSDPVYANTATFNADLVIDNNAVMTLPEMTSGPVSVAVPHVNVNKENATLTAADRRNGTITWNITVASHFSGYGQAVLTDTLPSDQEFMADQIFWGAVKLDETTNPSALISADGRTLTITFQTPEAWVTQQSLSVTTKIKTDNYGLNVNRDFSNTVRAAIYSPSTGLELDAMSDTDVVRIQNTVISKTAVAYAGNTSKQGENPRINYTIVINNNLMPLSEVLITDDLSRIITEYKRNADASFSVVSGILWTLVPGTVQVVKTAGTLDALNLSAIAGTATVSNGIFSLDFGDGVAVNDRYAITFTLETDINANPIFESSGSIRIRGNVAGVEAIGLKSGTILTPATGNSPEIKNEVLGKTGTHAVAEQQAVWTINLNQHRFNLKSTRVVDVLPLGLTLDPTSIKLYTNVIGPNGNFVTGNTVVTQGVEVPFTYTYLPATGVGNEGRFTLTVDLPDPQTAYVLRFATDVSPSLLGKQITNEAFLTGAASLPENNNTTNLTFSGSSGGGSITKASVTVQKTSKDTGALVDGGLFTLHWLRNGDPQDPVFVRTLSTVGGSVIFRGLTRGEIYTITETSAPAGYLLDDATPVVVIPPATGTADATAVTFENTPIKTATWTPTVIKQVIGRALTESFTFEVVYQGNRILLGTTGSLRPDGTAPVLFTAVNGVDLSGITIFTDSTTFDPSDPVGTRHLVAQRTFTLREIDGQLPGYSYDTTSLELNLSVYNVKGTEGLVMVVTDSEGQPLTDENGTYLNQKTPMFSNLYQATGQFEMVARKVVLGHALALDQFTFDWYEGDTLIGTATNDLGTWDDPQHSSAVIRFSSISYTEADVGIHTYRIVERETTQPGYASDESVYTVMVEVVDNGDGTLSSQITDIYRTVEGLILPATEIVFNNVYTTTDVEFSLAATKILTGAALNDGQFTFILEETDASGAVLWELQRVTNEGGVIEFAPLRYSQSEVGQVFYYTVRELSDMRPGYTFDAQVVVIRVEVLDDHDGTLSTDVTVTVDGIAVSEIVFTNRYQATGSLTLNALKVLDGRPLTERQFTFDLQSIDPQTLQALASQIVTHDAAGQLVIPSLTFTQADAGKTLIYRLSEINTRIPGYIYDVRVYWISVEVIDLGDGTLDLKVNFEEEVSGQRRSVDQLLFTNEYDESLIDGLPDTGANDFRTGLPWGLSILSLGLWWISRKRSQE